MLSKTYTSSLTGINAQIINLEVDVSDGFPGWNMVGLPEQVVKESKDRVRAALKNSGYGMPARKVTVNFSPADMKKRGTGFDLPLAIGLLRSSGFIPLSRLSDYLFVSELSLAGRMLPVNGVLATAVVARDKGFKGIVISAGNYREARLVPDIDVVGGEYLHDIVSYLIDNKRPEFSVNEDDYAKNDITYDFADVKGQAVAKRALEIAAAGNHNILMVGAPGTGKTMLAERLPTIMPILTIQESLETTKIYSAAGLLEDNSPLIRDRPFRAPHHSASSAGLFGGGSGVPSIGEISLAHNGVLFLDEMPEFRKDVIEVLRQPLESGYVNITRAGYSVKFPARFLLSAAMNPCRCGYYGHPVKNCICSVLQVRSYRQKLSGPLLDRIDLRIEVSIIKSEEMMSYQKSESSEVVKKRVIVARENQKIRYQKIPFKYNAALSSSLLKDFCPLDAESKRLISLAVGSKGYSARSVDRIIRVARTIADLEGSKDIRLPHIAEAMQHHRLDKMLQM